MLRPHPNTAILGAYAYQMEKGTSVQARGHTEENRQCTVDKSGDIKHSFLRL